MSASPLEAVLQFRRGAEGRVGPERVRLLRAIREHGSISAGGRAVGMTFRGAWDAVQAMNNLFERPLVVSQSGGARGGGATVTPAGSALIEGFERLDVELAELAERLERYFGEGESLVGHDLIWRLGMRTSARNALHGAVQTVTPGAVNCEVTLAIGGGVEIVAIITKASAEELGLAPGTPAIALIKSSFVILAVGDGDLRTSARNHLAGRVISHTPGAVNDEVVLEIAEGKTLTATVTAASARALGLEPGVKAHALIKASHVILAVD